VRAPRRKAAAAAQGHPQLGQRGDRRTRDATFGVARSQQVGDPVSELRQPIDGQRSPPAALEWHERKPILPSAQRRLRRRTAPCLGRLAVAGLGVVRLGQSEFQVEHVVTDDHVWFERSRAYELERLLSADASLKIAQLRRKPIGLLAVEVDAAPKHQVELVAKTESEPSLSGQIAYGSVALQVNELAIDIDAGLGRIAVDQGRQHAEGVRFVVDLEGETRRHGSFFAAW